MGNDYYSKEKTPTDSSGGFLRTEIRSMYFSKSLLELQSNDKELYSSSIGFESVRVSTEVDYITEIDRLKNQMS